MASASSKQTLELQSSTMPAFGYGNNLIIPRGTIYQIHFGNSSNRLFIIESFSLIRYPQKYLSKHGQLMEHSPYCERDIRTPQHLKTKDEQGDFIIKIKKKRMLYGLHYAHYPFAFSIPRL